MNLTSFLIYCIIATFTPGPTNIIILSSVHHFGAKQAMKYTYGSTAGFGLLLILSAVLNTILITIIPKILVVMQLVGSLYMLYLAYQMYRSDPSKPAIKHTATFYAGFTMQFLNPKVIIFTLTVIPTFILPYYHTYSVVMIYIAIIMLIGFLAFTTWVLFGTIFKRFLQKHHRIVNIVMALFLVYVAVMIWF